MKRTPLGHQSISSFLICLSAVLALAGCSGSNTDTLLNAATNSPPAPTSAAAQPTAAPDLNPVNAPGSATPVAAAPGGQATTPAGVPVAQQSTPIPQSDVPLSNDEEVVAGVFDRVGPAVVRIETDQGLGSGFLVDTSGHIITNNHVVAGSGGQVRVSFTGLFQTVGRVVGTDPDSDVAVVQAEELPQGAQPVVFADSSKVRVGQRTIAIGNPLGQDRTVTTGIVSAIGRTINENENQQGGYRIGGAIQTDAAINPGNSGGPLLDWSGRVIGMNTAILSQSGTSSGIGFAVPINLIKKVADELVAKGSYDHPFLGVGLEDVTTLQAKENNLPSAGVLIQPNGNDSPVARAGLRGAAILIAINQTAMTSSDDVISYLELNTKPGDTVTLTLIGDNKQQRDLQVQLGARPTVAR
jgi:S1-C subfamily serine protease